MYALKIVDYKRVHLLHKWYGTSTGEVRWKCVFRECMHLEDDKGGDLYRRSFYTKKSQNLFGT